MTYLNKFRIKNNMSVRELQKYLLTHGIKKSWTTIYRWCQGASYKDSRGLTMRNALKLATIVDVGLEELYKNYSETNSIEKASEIAPSDMTIQTES